MPADSATWALVRGALVARFADTQGSEGALVVVVQVAAERQRVVLAPTPDTPLRVVVATHVCHEHALVEVDALQLHATALGAHLDAGDGVYKLRTSHVARGSIAELVDELAVAIGGLAQAAARLRRLALPSREIVTARSLAHFDPRR